FEALLHDRAVIAGSGVIDQNIQLVVGAFGFLEQVLEAAFRPDIRPDEFDAPPQFANFLSSFFGRFTVSKEIDDQVCALAGESERNRPPDTPSAPCHQRNFSGKTFAHKMVHPVCEGYNTGW